MILALETVRFRKEIIPQSVTLDWMKKCAPGLLPSVARDYVRIRGEDFYGKFPAMPGEKPLYIAAAGAPCACKSTELAFELRDGGDSRYARSVFADPDRGALVRMYTYINMLDATHKAELGMEQAAVRAYDVNRPGSNIIANLEINEAVSGLYHLAHGTTLTGAVVPGLLGELGAEGYERRLLLTAAEEHVRWEALDKRNKVEGFYQVTPSDFAEKALLFPQRTPDYFRHGDHLILLWKHDLERRADRAAEFRDGKLDIIDRKAYGAYVDHYQQQRGALANLGKPVAIPEWAVVEGLYLGRLSSGGPASTPPAPGSAPAP
jgi:hypothetical protein